MMAMKAVECLARVTTKATVTVCCYYNGDAVYLGEQMQRAWGTMYPNADPDEILNLAGLQVRTVHGFIGQESDIAIIVTGAHDGPCQPTDWVFARQPGNVAISRGKQGVIVIGNMNYIGDERANSLGRFVRLAAEKCPIIDGDCFVEAMQGCTGNALTYRNYVKAHSDASLLYEREDPNPLSLVAQCELNAQNQWI